MLKGCLLNNNIDYVVLGLYEESTAESTPNTFDDVFNSPIVSDTDSDGIGDEWAETRPETEVTLRAIVQFTSSEELNMAPSGDKEQTLLMVMIQQEELKKNNLMGVNGTELRKNDRLKKVLDRNKSVKVDYTLGQSVGLFAVQILPPETGDTLWTIIFEDRATGPRVL